MEFDEIVLRPPDHKDHLTLSDELWKTTPADMLLSITPSILSRISL